jgi:hypothetical protein
VRSAKFLCIELTDPDFFLSRWSANRRAAAKANAVLGFPAVTISFTGLSPGIEEALTFLRCTQPAKFADAPQTFVG